MSYGLYHAVFSTVPELQHILHANHRALGSIFEVKLPLIFELTRKHFEEQQIAGDYLRRTGRPKVTKVGSEKQPTSEPCIYLSHNTHGLHPRIIINKKQIKNALNAIIDTWHRRRSVQCNNWISYAQLISATHAIPATASRNLLNSRKPQSLHTLKGSLEAICI